MEFRILGRLEVIEHGQQLALGGAKQRALMAVLLLRPGTAASVDLLVEQLWGECPPPTAAKTVQVYVSRLRKVLGDGLVETRGRGYALAVDPAQIDAGRFAALASAGRAALDAGDAKGAIELLGAALELWRGSPLESSSTSPSRRRRSSASRKRDWRLSRTASMPSSGLAAEQSWYSSSDALWPSIRCGSVWSPG